MSKNQHQHNEEELVERLKAGDRSVMQDLYKMYSDTFYGLCLKISKSHTQTAEDSLQEGFVKIWKYGKSYDPKKGRLFTWMLNIIRNTAIDKLRKANRKSKIRTDVGDVTTYESRLTDDQNTDTLDIGEKVNDLEKKYREVIDLAYFNGYTQKQISEELKMPLGTVKTRVRTALNKLRKIYKRS